MCTTVVEILKCLPASQHWKKEFQWNYQVRVAKIKDTTGLRDTMESALGMDLAPEEPLDTLKLKA